MTPTIGAVTQRVGNRFALRCIANGTTVTTTGYRHVESLFHQTVRAYSTRNALTSFNRIALVLPGATIQKTTSTLANANRAKRHAQRFGLGLC
jgi:hypothetical protein